MGRSWNSFDVTKYINFRAECKYFYIKIKQPFVKLLYTYPELRVGESRRQFGGVPSTPGRTDRAARRRSICRLRPIPPVRPAGSGVCRP